MRVVILAERLAQIQGLNRARRRF